jgi:hypothetical protein
MVRPEKFLPDEQANGVRGYRIGAVGGDGLPGGFLGDPFVGNIADMACLTYPHRRPPMSNRFHPPLPVD